MAAGGNLGRLRLSGVGRNVTVSIAIPPRREWQAGLTLSLIEDNMPVMSNAGHAR